MSTPIVTVVVPSYKTKHFMDECLPPFFDESLIGKVEVLLVDDGSPDDSFAYSQTFSKKYPSGYFKPVHKENGGHGSVINYGISIAKGKYIKVVDGDDYVDSKAFCELVDFLSCCQADLVVSDYYCSYPNKNVLVRGLKSIVSNPRLTDFNLALHSITVKTDSLTNSNFHVREKAFYEDNEYVMYIAERVHSWAYFPSAVYFYRLGLPGQSVSANFVKNHIGDFNLVVGDLISKYKNLRLNSPSGDITQLYADKLATLFASYIRHCLSFEINVKEKKRLIADLLEILKPFPEIVHQAKRKFKLVRFLSFFRFSKLGISISSRICKK